MKQQAKTAFSSLYISLVTQFIPAGHAIAEAVRCWLLTMDAWVQSEGSPCEICSGKSGSGSGFCLSTSDCTLPVIILTLHVHLFTALEGCGMYISKHGLCRRHKKVNLKTYFYFNYT
jgi:hypothetical protein